MADTAKEIIPVNLEDEMRRSYLDYAMSVIVGRALPDVRDGLKPVHRRVLFAMNELGNHANKPHVKSARIVGDVIGKYHPHGDSAVYDTIVRMAQDFSLRHMLVDGQGNFGSVDGDSAAAMRYTEIRLSKIAHEMLGDIDKETVDFGPNYDGSESEPLTLPARLPNLLVNGSAGIAVGMATNIPPHNVAELCAALEEVDSRQRAQDRPGLASLVVRQSDGLPGQGWWLSKDHDEWTGLFTGPEALKSVGHAARREILDLFPDLAELDYDPVPARMIPSGRKARKLVMRHLQNGRVLVS